MEGAFKGGFLIYIATYIALIAWAPALALATEGGRPGLAAGFNIDPDWTPAVLRMEEPTFQSQLYSAGFKWKQKNFKFTIGTIAQPDPDRSRFVAFITHQGKAAGICERIPLGVAPFDVNSMTLNCQGPAFGHKSVLTKFYYADASVQPQLLLPITGGSYRKFTLREDYERKQVAKVARVE